MRLLVVVNKTQIYPVNTRCGTHYTPTHITQSIKLGYQRVLVVHYSLGFTAYKAASWGVFFRRGTPKDAVYKDYKAKPLVRRSVHPRILQLRVLVVHYSLGFTAYKAASGGVFFRCGTPKDAVYKDYKAKPLVRRSVHPRILQFHM